MIRKLFSYLKEKIDVIIFNIKFGSIDACYREDVTFPADISNQDKSKNEPKVLMERWERNTKQEHFKNPN